MGIISIVGGGLLAQRERLALIASNLANADSIATPGGQPYRAIEPVFETVPLGNPGNGVSTVAVAETVQSSAPPQLKYDPGNPYADRQGYVTASNVSQEQQMIDLIDATQNYSAEIAVLDQSSKLGQSMIQSMVA